MPVAILNSSDQRISLSDGEQGMLCDIASEMQTLASDLEAFQHMFCDIVESGQSVALHQGQALDELSQRAAALGRILTNYSRKPDADKCDLLEGVTLGRLVNRLNGTGHEHPAADEGELDLF
ncbi:MAG: hypothetical protein CME88_08715 [Hirschia sp.]|nr:hypothetical protein [Hirschia sp.]MBF18444.1 hypothetical protein [Hirschia sp.]|tara:strand:- start:340 stop:705 length:366 start_codon:yes stop_codon:yes gene_type:complete